MVDHWIQSFIYLQQPDGPLVLGGGESVTS